VRPAQMSQNVKGYGCRPSTAMTWLRGRRPEASREGTRGMEIAALGLWGFDGSAWLAVAAPMRLADEKG
jgi:hypothetical protein